MSEAYYGFKVKGNTAKFLEQFKDFYWITGEKDIGFLGIKINSSEYVEKSINFPKFLEVYMTINNAQKNPNSGLAKILLSYWKNEKDGLIWMESNVKNMFFKTWKEYEENKEIQKDDFWIGGVKIGMVGKK